MYICHVDDSVPLGAKEPKPANMTAPRKHRLMSCAEQVLIRLFMKCFLSSQSITITYYRVRLGGPHQNVTPTIEHLKGLVVVDRVPVLLIISSRWFIARERIYRHR